MIHCDMKTNRTTACLLVISVQAVDQYRKDPRFNQVIYGRVAVTGQQLPTKTKKKQKTISHTALLIDENVKCTVWGHLQCKDKAAGCTLPVKSFRISQFFQFLLKYAQFNVSIYSMELKHRTKNNYVWRLCWPVHDLKPIILFFSSKALVTQPGGMFWVIILLQDPWPTRHRLKGCAWCCKMLW